MYANDLNPSSYEYLCTNIKINRLGGRVLPFNADGRAFMRAAAAGALDVGAAAAVVPPPPVKSKAQAQQAKQQGGKQGKRLPEAQQQEQAATGAPEQQPAAAAAAPAAGGSSAGSAPFHHIVMNLPASAVEFLDALNGAFEPALWEGRELPLVHVYTFAKGEEELAGGQG